MNTLTSIYEDIAARTAGDIYLGVVARPGRGNPPLSSALWRPGPPSIDDDYRRQRARDELPQSGSGRTVMTAEPKIVPEEAVEIAMEGAGPFPCAWWTAWATCPRCRGAAGGRGA